LASQIRSAISIPSNIAEWAARDSKKDLVRILYIALGPLAEPGTHFLVAKNFSFLSEGEGLSVEVKKIRNMLLG